MAHARHLPRLILTILAVTLGFHSHLVCQMRPARSVTDLNHGWQFRQIAGDGAQQRADWMPATVPGDVHLDLLREKLIPEPFYRDNENKLQWIEHASWEYRLKFEPTAEQRAHRNLDVVFDGLDAACQVYLNDSLLLRAENMHRSWRASIKGRLRSGVNTLRIVFPSPIDAAHEVAISDSWQQKTGVTDEQYIRKAGYEYGWDWGPRFVTSGIWRPVRLESWDDARIANLHVEQRDVSATIAHLNASVEIEAMTDGAADVSIAYVDGGRSMTLHRAIHLNAGTNHVDVPIEILNPRLWFPAGYGAQPLYTFTARVSEHGRTEDTRDQVTGLRAVSLRRDLDRWGRSFEFVVNGVPVFAKGANVIPIDSFPSRVTPDRYRYLLQSARDANMNMIRVWGGGYYEEDEFYAICDKLGLMVWQDFMFGNRWQPGTYSFKQEIEKEATEQVRRLRDHPSIVLWCGNNETESLFELRAASATHPPAVRMQMRQDYMSEFSGILSRVVAALAPEVPYWPSSPSADYEATSAKFVSGDVHDWSVWHGRVPFSTYEKHNYRFVSEYGFQSFPDLRTIEGFTLPEDRASIFTPVMLSHQKSGIGNSVIQDYLVKDYPQPKDFSSFIYVSQILQAEGVKIGTEHWRRNRPETMGTLFWQLNDCWPVASWSSIDSDGRWKALQYYARRFYAPLLVSPHIEEDAIKVFVVSDKTQQTTGTLRSRLMDFKGKVLLEQSKTIQVSPAASQVYAEWPLSQVKAAGVTDMSQVFVVADLTTAEGDVSRNLLYLTPTKQVHLPAVALATSLTGDRGAYSLAITAPELARSVHVSFGNLDAQLGDDYFDLLPGETRRISVKSLSTRDALLKQLSVISLSDAFAKSAVDAPAVKPN